MQLDFDNETYRDLKRMANDNNLAIKTMITRLIEQGIAKHKDQGTHEGAVNYKVKEDEHNK